MLTPKNIVRPRLPFVSALFLQGNIAKRRSKSQRKWNIVSEVLLDVLGKKRKAFALGLPKFFLSR
jgi:hypothetical protein